MNFYLILRDLQELAQGSSNIQAHIELGVLILPTGIKT